MTKEELKNNIAKRVESCWQMAQTFIDNRDDHGVMDIGAELQSLNRALKEIEKL